MHTSIPAMNRGKIAKTNEVRSVSDYTKKSRVFNAPEYSSRSKDKLTITNVIESSE